MHNQSALILLFPRFLYATSLQGLIESFGLLGGGVRAIMKVS